MVSDQKPRSIRTTNPGDRIIESESIEEKAKQLAVDAPDITGDHIQVPTYFVVKYPSGEQKALHHVRDAQAISDVIRLARFEQEESEPHKVSEAVNFNGLIFVFILALVLITVPFLIGIF